MEKPLVSVLMASYNHARYVERAVLSVLEQKNVPFELIVLDDGSNDASPEILKKLSEEYGFTFIHRENKGVVLTMQELLSLAGGKYFCTFASDDIMPPDRLQRQSLYLETHPECPACFGQIIPMDSSGNKAHTFDPRYTSAIPEISFEEFFLGKKELHGCTEMINTEVFRSLGGYNNESQTEDFQMMLSLLSVYKKLPVLNINCCFYRIHENNLSKNKNLIYEASLRVLENYKTHPLYKKAVATWKSHWFSALAYANKKEALLKIPELYSFSVPFFKRFLKLFIPRFLLKR